MGRDPNTQSNFKSSMGLYFIRLFTNIILNSLNRGTAYRENVPPENVLVTKQRLLNRGPSVSVEDRSRLYWSGRPLKLPKLNSLLPLFSITQQNLKAKAEDSTHSGFRNQAELS